MTSLFQSSDLRRLLGGTAAVAVAGLLTGAAMQPNLRADERPEGPQIMAGVSGVRTPYYGDPGAAWTYHAEKVPEYVIGADWLKAGAPDATVYQEFEILPEAETAAFYDEAPLDEPAPTVRAWEEPPRAPPHYPSLAGGVPYGADLPRPPEPPAEAEDAELAEMAAATPS